VSLIPRQSIGQRLREFIVVPDTNLFRADRRELAIQWRAIPGSELRDQIVACTAPLDIVCANVIP
jgi:hypothetical protein